MAAGDIPSLTPAFNPGAAFWCTEHGRMECQRNTVRGNGRCHAPAIRGTDACRKHVGYLLDVALLAGEANVSAWRVVGNGGPPLDPGHAVMSMLKVSWLRAATYGELLRRQVERAQPQESPDGSDDESLLEFSDVEQAGDIPEMETSGLIGHTWAAAGKDGTLYKSGEMIRALVQLEERERDRVVKYAKIAHDMGISDRLADQVERWGGVVAGRVSDMFEEMNLTPEQQHKLPSLVERYLSSIEVDVIDGQVLP